MYGGQGRWWCSDSTDATGFNSNRDTVGETSGTWGWEASREATERKKKANDDACCTEIATASLYDWPHRATAIEIVWKSCMIQSTFSLLCRCWKRCLVYSWFSFCKQEPRHNLFGDLRSRLCLTAFETRCAFALQHFAIYLLDSVAHLSESHMHSSMF